MSAVDDEFEDGWADIDGEVIEAHQARNACLVWLGAVVLGYLIIGIVVGIIAAVLDLPALAVIGWAWPLGVGIILLGVGAFF